jgi:hypothetical protein
VHSLKSLLPEQCTKESMETAKDEVKPSESDDLESPSYEDSDDYEESSISELVRINIDCESLF